ncbi:hypothetical protein PtA15_6A885 [Puccinia triticina]|uniref:Uncharacterized protein n=1 Tax=Puccinia triticina TaxID=208348 RepID=A0ABY7CMU8_9BASI|nr:uncharacterized protein PtA15_6A885 [Puccinia triticina]WAQ86253.1 hypothetical protein PtA15_6A885 [Puccinia triticina]
MSRGWLEGIGSVKGRGAPGGDLMIGSGAGRGEFLGIVGRIRGCACSEAETRLKFSLTGINGVGRGRSNLVFFLPSEDEEAVSCEGSPSKGVKCTYPKTIASSSQLGLGMRVEQTHLKAIPISFPVRAKDCQVARIRGEGISQVLKTLFMTSKGVSGAGDGTEAPKSVPGGTDDGPGESGSANCYLSNDKPAINISQGEEVYLSGI